MRPVVGRADEDRAIRAWQRIEQGGSVDDLPPADLSRLDAETMAALDRRARQVREGTEPVTDDETYARLVRLAADEPQAFCKLNLLQYREALDDDWRRLAGLQGGAEGSTTGRAFHRVRTQMVDRALGEAGIDPDAEPGSDAARQAAAVHRAVDQMIEAEGAGKPSQLPPIIDQALLLADRGGPGIDTNDDPDYALVRGVAGEDSLEGGTGDDVQEAAIPPVAVAAGALIVRGLLALGRRGKRRPDPDKRPPRPLPPELVIDLFAKKFRESGDTKVVLRPSDFGHGTDDEAAIRGFIDSHVSGRLVPGGQHVAQLDLGELDAEFVERLKKDTGVDLSGYRQAIDTGQVNKIFKKHGEGTETDAEQVPVTPETMSLYLRVIENYDTVSVRGKDRGDTFTFSKKVDGVVVVIEQMREKAGEFALFNMYIKKAKQ